MENQHATDTTIDTDTNDLSKVLSPGQWLWIGVQDAPENQRQLVRWESPSSGVLRGTARNGLTIMAQVTCAPQDLLEQMAVHGLKQKLGDAAALERNRETGRSATDAEKIAAVESVAARLMEGYWNAPATGGRGGADGDLAAAIAELSGKGLDETREALAAKTAAERAALRVVPRVAAILERLAAERSAGVDGDALLDALF